MNLTKSVGRAYSPPLQCKEGNAACPELVDQFTTPSMPAFP
jgi:hypothetical protein